MGDTGVEDLLTDRLLLRPVTPDDVDALYAITSDERTSRHSPEGRHDSPDVTSRWIARARELWDRDGLSYWLVRRRDTEEVIGVGGVQRQTTGNWNLYYRFAPSAWGHGYATELSRAALAAAHAHDDSVAVIAWVRDDNVASRRVAERVGLVDRGTWPDPSDGTPRHAYADRPVTLD